VYETLIAASRAEVFLIKERLAKGEEPLALMDTRIAAGLGTPTKKRLPLPIVLRILGRMVREYKY
jgi:hypothetical protein